MDRDGINAGDQERTEGDLENKSDAELVRLIRNRGDNQVFGILVTRYRSYLAMVAMSILGRGSDVEDMIQEAYLRAYTNIDLLADEARFGAWLKRILFGCCIDFLRRRARSESDPIEDWLERIPDNREAGGSAYLASQEFADDVHRDDTT